MNPPRNRIKRHIQIRAGDLLPHELNPRLHSDAQRAALAALYEEIGFARSLLAYELPDARLKLIDGHLRAGMDPDMLVEVEVLDVNDAEARKLLLAIDPLAQLVSYDAAVLTELRALTEPDSPAIQQLWEAVAASGAAALAELEKTRRTPKEETLPGQFLILVECGNEEEQTRLLERFQREGLKCKALLS